MVMSKLWLTLPFIAFGLGVHYFRSAWVSLLLYHLFLLCPLIINRKRWEPSAFFKGFSWLWLIIHLGGCAAICKLLIYLAEKEGFGGEILQDMVFEFGGGIVFAIYLIAINPVVEEGFWRGLMATRGKKLKIEDLAFGSFHAVILFSFISPVYLIGLVCFLTSIGWTWRQLRWKYSGLAMPWIGHVLGDVMFVFVVGTSLQ